MPFISGNKSTKGVGSWQELFEPSSSERVQRAKKRVLRPMEICLERARAEKKAYKQYKNEPCVIQRARVWEVEMYMAQLE